MTSAPERLPLADQKLLRDSLIGYIVARDKINAELAKSILNAMDAHELTLLELEARARRPIAQTEYDPLGMMPRHNGYREGRKSRRRIHKSPVVGYF
jgi:hypothetical protein